MMIAGGIDMIPKDAGYIDERLVFRAQNIVLGLNLLGQECEKELQCNTNSA